MGWADVVAPVVDEPQPAGCLGVAVDGVGALVVKAVMERTQADQVPGDGEPAVFAVDEVMDVHPAAL